MKTFRHRARELAFQLLYRMESLDASLAKPTTTGQTLPEGQALLQELRSHFEHFEAPEETRTFASTLFIGTLARLPELDELLVKHSQHWALSRMSSVDRAILRLSLYELLHEAEIPVAVTINEAIELAKTYGTAESASFVNGLLDAISKDHPKTAPST